MILDSGVCTIYKKRDVSAPGEKPRYTRDLLGEGYYGEMSFETNPDRPTTNREEVRTDARIRVLQDRRINKDCEVVLADAGHTVPGAIVYSVTRAYHGKDDENGEPITDLSLTEVGVWS